MAEPTTAEVRAAVRAVAQGVAADLMAMGRGLESGDLNLPAFALGARATIKAAHLAATAAAAGGFARLTPAQVGRLGGKLKGLYAALTDLEFQYRSGQISAAMLAARVATLARGAMGTFENAVLAVRVDGGSGRVRRVLGAVATEHCGDCVALAGLGFVPAVEVVPIGSCECSNNCHCHYEFEDDEG